MTARIPLTVIGGYLGAGKTTLVNHLLRDANGRRIAVIVNDFGSLAIDADLLAGADRDGDVIGLANGCVCCTVGAGLHDALARLTDRERPPDHIVIEVSGVANPAAAAAWGTVAPFESGGVIVLADATTVMQLARDRYVGAEVRRQLAGADLVVLTKVDLCDRSGIGQVKRWLDESSDSAPIVEVVDGVLPAEVILGVRSDPSRTSTVATHADYASWSWTSHDTVKHAALRSMISALPDRVLRVKGVVALDDGSAVSVQVVGRRSVIRVIDSVSSESQLVAIGLRTDPPTPSPFLAHLG